MLQTVTHIDAKRSILWTFEDQEHEKFCRLLTNLYLWIANDTIQELSNDKIADDLNKLILNINTTISIRSKYLHKIKVLERNRVDDLIY
jgi:hypothetical protein